MSKLLTIRQVCRVLKITERTFRNMVSRREFPEPIRRNRRWVRIPQSDLEEFLHRLEASRQLPA